MKKSVKSLRDDLKGVSEKQKECTDAALEQIYRYCTAVDDRLEKFRRVVSELLEFRRNAEIVEIAWYRAGDVLEDSTEGFRQDVSELLSAGFLMGSLMKHRIYQGLVRALGHTKGSGAAVVDRSFERHAERVFERIREGRLGAFFRSMEEHYRKGLVRLDAAAAAKHRFGKKVEACIDAVFEKFLENRKRWTAVMAGTTCCFMAFCMTVNAGTVYNYYYHGTEIGTVKDKEEVVTAVEQLKEEVPEVLEVEVAVQADPDVDITYEKEFSFSAAVDSAEEIADKLTNIDELEGTGYAIRVNGQVVALVDTEATAEKIMETVRSAYCTADPEEESLTAEAMAATAESYAGDQDGIEIGGALVNPADTAAVRSLILEDSMNSRTGTVTAASETVPDESGAFGEAQELSLVPAYAGLDFSQIDVEKLQGITLDHVAITDEVTIEPVTAKVSQFSDYDKAIGYFVDEAGLSKIFNISTAEIEVYTEEIPYEVTYEDSEDLYEGENSVKVTGVNGVKQLVASVVKDNGQEISREIVSSTVLTEPVNQVVLRGTKEKPSWVASGTFMWPASGRFSSGFGSRWGRQHKGIDIAGSSNSDIVAADGGTVIFAGYNSSGYGNLVKIDHGNGYETVYAHNNSLCVSVGDKVYKGQVIAKMGSTGRSTGTHCHFEIHKNGTAVNPMNYLS
ncbi:MAG: M23 family metallopeptidase [Anaerovoracaceae bacterium]